MKDQKDSRMNVYIDPEVIKEAKLQAIREDKSLSQFVEDTLKEKLNKK